MNFLLRDGKSIAGTAAAIVVCVIAAGCASQPAAPVAPPPKKAAPPAATVTQPAPKPAPPPVVQPAPKPAAPVTAKPAPKSAPPKPEPLPARLGDTKMAAKDVQAILAHHNKVRAAVGVPPLKWSPTLANYSQKWTDYLAGSSCRVEHRSDNQYGENIYAGTAGHFTAVDAAKAWEAEKKSYDGTPLKQSIIKAVGHYTQITWRDTRMLGCGEALCNKMLLVVCNYDPPGNYIGQLPY